MPSFTGHPARQGQEQSSTEEISLQTPGSVNDTGLTVSHPPSGLKFYMMFLGVALALVFSGLDESIVATDVSKITDDFGTIADVGWYYSAYFQFFFGKLYTIFSVKMVFMIALGAYQIGSLLSAIAPTSAALVIGRAVSGFGCAGLIAGTFVIISRSVLTHHIPIYGAVGGGIEVVSSSTGPLLGGIITQALSWRWCFYINLPVGGLSFFLIPLSFRDTSVTDNRNLTFREKIMKVDMLSTAVFIPSIATLLLALQWGGTKYGWFDARIIALFSVYSISFLFFGRLQWRRGDKATLPLRILSRRTMLSGMWFCFCTNSALAIVDYYMPTYFQTVKQVSPSEYYAPVMLLPSVMSPIGSGLLTTFTTDANLSKLICFQALLGFGIGIGIQAPQVAAQTTLSSEDIPIGISAVMFAHGIGPAVFVSAAQSIFISRLKVYLADFSTQANATLLGDSGLNNMISHVEADKLQGVLKACDKAVTEAFFLPVTLTILGMAGAASIRWHLVKQRYT